MTFTVQGTVHGTGPVNVTWEDGAVRGTPGPLMAVESLIKAGVQVQLPGVWECPATITDPTGALATLLTAFDDDAQVVGEPPTPAALPPGAIP